MTLTMLPTAIGWLQAAVLPENLQATRIAVDQGWLATLSQIAQSFVSIALLVFLVTGAYLAIALRRSIERITALIHGSSGEFKTMTQDVGAVAKDLRELTERIRRDAGEVSDTVHIVREQTLAALESVEVRLKRFETMVDVVQEEAEDIVVGAVSTIRGLKAASSSLRGVFARNRGGDEESDSPDEYADEDLDDFEEDEEDDDEIDIDEQSLAMAGGEGSLVDFDEDDDDLDELIDDDDEILTDPLPERPRIRPGLRERT